MGLDVVVLSTRLLLGDAIGFALRTRSNLTVGTVDGLSGLRDALDADARAVVIVDLEAPSAGASDIGAVLDETDARRRGVYDRFTPEIALLAFEMGISRPISLTAPPELLLGSLHSTDAANVTRIEGPTRRELDQLAALSARELQVLGAIASGLRPAAVADLLGVTPHTVGTHWRRTMRKLEVGSTTQAIALYLRAGGDVSRESTDVSL